MSELSYASLAAGVGITLYGGYKYFEAWRRHYPISLANKTNCQQIADTNRALKNGEQKELAIKVMMAGLVILGIYATISYVQTMQSISARFSTTTCQSPQPFIDAELRNFRDQCTAYEVIYKK